MRELWRVYRRMLVILLFVAAADMLSRDAILPVVAPQAPTPDVPLPVPRPPSWLLQHFNPPVSPRSLESRVWLLSPGSPLPFPP